MEDINKNISEKRETPKFSYEVRNNGDVIFIKGGNEDQLFELAWQIFKKLDGSKFFHPSIKDGLKNGEDTRPQYGIYGIKFRKDHIYYRELLGLVLKERIFKKNTILINLQNKKYFKRLEDGRYTVNLA